MPILGDAYHADARDSVIVVPTRGRWATPHARFTVLYLTSQLVLYAKPHMASKSLHRKGVALSGTYPDNSHSVPQLLHLLEKQLDAYINGAR